ncbi:MAG: radical SAM protein [Bacteroidales bacterium]|nr:radical SAM protein [Bacteroidales bacterium]
MKKSYYNIPIPLNNNFLYLNTKSEGYTILSKKYHDFIENEKYDLIEKKILSDLYDNGLLIEDDINEFQDLCREYTDSVNNDKTYYLTLIPSLDCNLNCWYCFESHIRGSRLNVQIKDHIIKYILYLFEEKGVEVLHVMLFGGEPLLYFQEELYPLLLKIKEVAQSINKLIYFSFITNGVLINEDFYPLFKNLKANFQISIDGYRDKHDTVKKLKNCNKSTYDHIIKILFELTNYYNAYINLRINYDNNTLKRISEIINDIKKIDRKKINIHLERVWQTEDYLNKDPEILKNVINSFLSSGFRVSYLNLFRRNISCKVSKYNQAVISYDGKVYKCSGRNFDEKMVEGYLLSNGQIKWDVDKLTQRLSINTFDNDMCRKCKLLPLCWGPCCQKQMEASEKDFHKFCPLNHMEMPLSDYILYRFNNEYVSQQLMNS